MMHSLDLNALLGWMGFGVMSAYVVYCLWLIARPHRQDLPDKG